MRVVDLRSDTVTHPTQEMRQAMASAAVGDDVYGEDPSVNRLEALAATICSKPAGLFVPSGTMGNLAAILTHCARGDEMILGQLAHTFLFEAGGASALGGVHVHPVPNQVDGSLRLEDIQSAIRSDDAHHPRTRLIVLENTHNRCGGMALSLEYTESVGILARQHGLRLHLDGARIFNAAVALGVSAAELAAPADSVTFCLSKGLCAPVGSVLCGPVEFIAQARRIRKQLGGGMRQAGVLAVAGIIALERMVDRLQEDHDRAARLALGLSRVPGVRLDPGSPATNMIYLTLGDQVALDARQVAQRLEALNVRVSVVAARRFRLVTHYWIDDSGLDQTVEAFQRVLTASNV